MLAYHPITGKEIRIIQTEASISKKKRTISVGRVRGDIWDSIGTKKSEQTTFSLALGYISEDELLQRSKESKLVFLQKEKNLHFTQERLQELRIQNMICLEEIKDLYPHLGYPWDETEADAIVLIAGLLRYRFLANFDSPLSEREKLLGLQRESQKQPPRLWWVTQYYKPVQTKRRQEIDTCLFFNTKSELIDNILLLNEKEEVLPIESNRITQKIIGHRLTYMDVMEAAKDIPDDVILAFANADICIDSESWRNIWDIDITNKCLALLRWDVPESGNQRESKIFGPRTDSQDTWIVRVADVKGRASWQGLSGIPFGQMGCDNAFALEMLRAKFTVINPSLSLKTYHYHTSAVRTYNNKDVVERPAFLYVKPTGIHDLDPVIAQWPEKSILAKSIPPPLVRKLEGSGAQAWMERVNKTVKVGQESWTKQGTHILKSSPEIVLTFQNVWESEDGLCYDKDNMYIGQAEAAQVQWSKAQIRSLSPSVISKEAIIVPIREGAMENRENYILQYLSKVLRLRLLGKGIEEQEFLCPESKEFIDCLHMFHWGSSRIPVLKYEKDQQIWCEKAIYAPISDNHYVLPDDITSLRQMLLGWKSEPVEENGIRTLIFVQDNDVLTEGVVNDFEVSIEDKWNIRVIYPGRTSPERIRDSMCGAWGIVFSASSGVKGWAWNWLLPKEAYVFEVGGGSSPSGDALTFSASAGLHHIFVKSPKELYEEAEIRSAMTRKTDETTIWLPRKDLEGYFAHAGDSFREMAKIWGKRGYVQVKEHPTATMCWWNSVGENGVLLYDRPTHEWRLAAPTSEKSYRGALYGNPTPPEQVGNAYPWFFWPRRPELVEELVAEGVSKRPWEDRVVGPVFYGKIENKVQERRRVGVKQPDWSVACEKGEWFMVKGVDTKYPFTQKEYIEKLSKARFGLCLAGYGLKCHREIECMSMGCVPLVSPDVDMNSYFNPPVEGVHFIRVETPEQASKIAFEMSRESWEKMSTACFTWWKENASAEGSFELTKKILQRM